MNKDIIKTLFPERYQLIEEGKCPECTREVNHEKEFEDDETAMREFLISGLCRACQDKTFNEDMA